jgi:hypothetical protein
MGQNVRIKATFPQKISGLARKEKAETHQFYQAIHGHHPPHPAHGPAQTLFKIELHLSVGQDVASTNGENTDPRTCVV